MHIILEHCVFIGAGVSCNWQGCSLQWWKNDPWNAIRDRKVWDSISWLFSSVTVVLSNAFIYLSMDVYIGVYIYRIVYVCTRGVANIIYANVYVYINMFMCMYMYMDICAYIIMYAPEYVYVYIYIWVRVCIFMLSLNVCIGVYIYWIMCVYASVSTSICLCMSVSINVCIHMYVYVHEYGVFFVCLGVCIWVWLCICISVYMYVFQQWVNFTGDAPDERIILPWQKCKKPFFFSFFFLDKEIL